MFSLTRQERWLIILVVVALVTGTVVKQWRSSMRAKAVVEVLATDTN